jgi:hypothetical protein
VALAMEFFRAHGLDRTGIVTSRDRAMTYCMIG